MSEALPTNVPPTFCTASMAAALPGFTDPPYKIGGRSPTAPSSLPWLLGGFAGQFVVGLLVQGPITWRDFWLYALVVLAAAVIILSARGVMGILHRAVGLA